jgi:hypothetical protein
MFVRIEVELRKIQAGRPDLGVLVPPAGHAGLLLHHHAHGGGGTGGGGGAGDSGSEEEGTAAGVAPGHTPSQRSLGKLQGGGGSGGGGGALGDLELSGRL